MQLYRIVNCVARWTGGGHRHRFAGFGNAYARGPLEAAKSESAYKGREGEKGDSYVARSVGG